MRRGSVPVAVIPMASKTARVMGRTHGPPQDRTRVQCSTPVGCSPPCMYGCAHRRGHFEPGAVNSKLVSAPCDKVAAWLSAIRRRDRALPRVAKARRPARGRERAFELTLNPTDNNLCPTLPVSLLSAAVRTHKVRAVRYIERLSLTSFEVGGWEKEESGSEWSSWCGVVVCRWR